MQAEYLVYHLLIGPLGVVYRLFLSTIELSGSQPGKYDNQGITTKVTK